MAFLAACVVVPVLANGVRAFATIWAADLTSVEAAAGFDHIVYGWVFFAAVMAGVLALGWRWFDRAPDDLAFDPARLAGPVRHRLDLLPAALLALGVASPAVAKKHKKKKTAVPAVTVAAQVPFTSASTATSTSSAVSSSQRRWRA